MAGIFIDEGAICQFNEKGQRLVVLKDMNRGVIYTGPLVVLVNGLSASASELVAGSLQDYNRAVIVGNRTHGKGTSQEIFQVENKANVVVNTNENNFLKITQGKFYRVNGKSSQFYGVVPDVHLPDLFEVNEYESDIPFALKPDTIPAYKYFKPLKASPKAILQERSKSRIANNQNFKNIQLQRERSKPGVKTNVSLLWDDLESKIKQGVNHEKVKLVPANAFVVMNNAADHKFIASSDIAKEINQSWLDRIALDPYIEETFFIVLDLINQSK